MTLIFPGDEIGKTAEIEMSSGFYEENGTLFASLGGFLSFSSTKESSKKVGIISRKNDFLQNVTPTVGDTIIARIIRIGDRFCNCEIVSINNCDVKNSFSALLRKENIRLTEIDRIVIKDCFRPNDNIKAEVISLGSLRSYELSTAKDEYGVVEAISKVSNTKLLALNEREMQCQISGEIEKRKVAKVV